jgi:hypothetical protein
LRRGRSAPGFGRTPLTRPPPGADRTHGFPGDQIPFKVADGGVLGHGGRPSSSIFNEPRGSTSLSSDPLRVSSGLSSRSWELRASRPTFRESPPTFRESRRTFRASRWTRRASRSTFEPLVKTFEPLLAPFEACGELDEPPAEPDELPVASTRPSSSSSSLSSSSMRPSLNRTGVTNCRDLRSAVQKRSPSDCR